MMKGNILKLCLFCLISVIFYELRHFNVVTLTFEQRDGKSDRRADKHSTRNSEWIQAIILNTEKAEQREHRCPDVIGIGVQKCGTRAVHNFLQFHPYIRALKYESHFFDQNKIEGLDYYRQILPTAADHELVMEKTPAYFRTLPDNLPQIMHQLMPNLKIIIILCNPTRRALSGFVMAQTRNNKSENFDSYVKGVSLKNLSENANKVQPQHIYRGIYHANMGRWINEFPDSHFIINGEDFLVNPGLVIEELQDFLKIPKLLRREDFFRNETTGLFCVKKWWEKEMVSENWSEKSNVDSCLLHKGMTRSKVALPHFSMSNNTRQVLNAFYRPHNEILYKMLGRNFGW
ncbi:heparan sulfate glucosamine 3-O-sulfotransferase 6-like [Styela clava]